MNRTNIFKHKRFRSGILILFLLAMLSITSGCSPRSLPSAAPTLTLPIPSSPTITPISLLTPVPTLAPRWTQYQDALSKTILNTAYPPESAGVGLCEWAVLGHSDQEVYVWALCQVASTALGTAGSVPAVIKLAPDGNIEGVVIPGDGSDYGVDIRKLFPAEVQERIDAINAYFDPQTAMKHIDLRRADPTIPPLIVEAGTPLP